MYYIFRLPSTLFVLQFRLMIRLLLISLIMPFFVGGFDLKWRHTAMIMPSAQSSNQTPTPSNSGSSDQGYSEEEIRALEQKVAKEESANWWANKTTLALLGIYGVLSLAIAFATLWINRSSDRLRTVDSLLGGVRIAKVKADASNEGKRIEEEGKRRVAEVEAQAAKDKKELENKNLQLRADLESAKAEAQSKIEEARADAETKIESAKADAAREIGRVQTELARQQARAAEAEKELAQVKEYASLRLKSGEQLKVISERLKNLPRGKLKVFWAANDLDAYNLADNTVEVFRMLGWQVDGPERTLEALFPIAIASENPNDGPTMLAIVEAFRAAGFDGRGSSTFKLPPGRIVIVVGSQQRTLFPKNHRANE